MKKINRLWKLYGHQIVRAGFLALSIFAANSLIEEHELSLIGQLVTWSTAFLLWLFIAMQIEPIYEQIEDDTENSTGSVTINFKLKNGEFGSEQERQNIFSLTDELDKIVTNEEVGEYDGNEFGNGECELYFFSTEPNKLFKLIKPIFLKSEYVESASVEIEDISGSIKKESLNNE